jgi:hypothetical protein
MAMIVVPSGSSSENTTITKKEVVFLDPQLNSFADGADTGTLSYSNPSGATNAKVIIILGEIEVVSGTIRIDNGTDYYEQSVASGIAAKRLEFNNIPASFLSSFTIKNMTGMALASSENSLTIMGI